MPFLLGIGHAHLNRTTLLVRSYSTLHVSEKVVKLLQSAMRARWGTALDKYEDCIQCRECEEKCPYELPILELMANQVDWLRKTYGDKLEELEPVH